MSPLRLDTPRLHLRPFTLQDLDAVYQILDVEIDGAPAEDVTAREQRLTWLDWTVRNGPALEALYQPPYGDLAVTLRDTGEIIGAAGFVPVLAPLGQLPGWDAGSDPATASRYVPEVGLYWAISPRHQRQGFATEIGRALCAYGFSHLNLRRIVATTTHDNLASQGVMRKLGMRLERNPLPEPPWLQVVGRLDYAGWRA
jgi:RimJ/RimL family protein N-acetyltransferase